MTSRSDRIAYRAFAGAAILLIGWLWGWGAGIAAFLLCTAFGILLIRD